MALFSEFPAFRKLVIDDKDIYEAIYKDYEPYADLSFGNLILWLDISNDAEVADDQYGNIIFRYSNPYNFNKQCYTILARDMCHESLLLVFEFQAKNDLEKKVEMLPSIVIDDLKKKGHLDDYTLVLEEFNRNYIYSVSDTVLLDGNHYKKLRSKIRHFRNSYEDRIEFKMIDLGSHNETDKLLESLEDWLGSPLFTSDRLGDSMEDQVICRQIQFHPKIPGECLGLYIDGVLQGFTLFHHMPQKNYIIANHIKCNYHFPGIFDFIFYSLAEHCKKEGIEFINGEQDLGLENLRLHKNQLRPHHYLDIYTVSPK